MQNLKCFNKNFPSGGSPVLYTASPRGDCDNCCAIREAKDIKFLMYNKKYPKDGKQLYVNDAKRLRHLDKSLPLMVYLHGFTEMAPGPPKSSAYEIKEGKRFTLNSVKFHRNPEIFSDIKKCSKFSIVGDWKLYSHTRYVP